ncbi:hypothetical protein Tco_0501511, partial [Tanacetum coccineum]
MKEIGDGCCKCRGPYPSSECDDKTVGEPEEEANYAYGGYQGNYYGRNSEHWRDRQPREDNCNSQPHEDDRPTPPIPKKKLEESNFVKTMREFMVAQRSSNEF